ncbi:lipase family protein [Nocardia sp. CA-128927]|uniref:lipase family protein n=1 Tax=Nocardia sp. CA-128927 TaxID=3239975 RepID=UPI003D98D6C5
MQDYTVGGLWPLDIPGVENVVEALQAGHYGTPVVPMYVYIGMNEEIAPVSGSDHLVADYCARGVDVTYTKYPVLEHASAELVAVGAAVDWLAQRLTDTPTTPTCGAPEHAKIGFPGTETGAA